MAVTSSTEPPLTIERLESVGEVDRAQIASLVSQQANGKGVRYIPAHVSVFPDSRLFARHSVDTPNKLKEQAYLEDVLRNQLRIDPDKNTVAVLNAGDGTSLDLTRNLANQKELLFAGAKQEAFVAAQDAVIQQGVFPERLTMGSLAMLGGLLSYVRYCELKRPLLALELDAERAHAFVITTDRVEFCRSLPLGLDSMLPVLQGELGLRDEESARKLLYSNTFDFTETGASLLRKLLKELQASIGFHEVQTGQSIGHLFVHLLPDSMSWVSEALTKALGIKRLKIDYGPWLEYLGITLDDEINLQEIGPQWFSLLSLLPNFSATPNAVEAAAANAS